MTLLVQWTTVVNAQAYYLYVGSTIGAKDLVDTREIQQTSWLASLPGGQTVYARIWTKVGAYGATPTAASLRRRPRRHSRTRRTARPMPT